MDYSDIFTDYNNKIIEDNKTFVTFQPGCKVNHDIREKHGINSNIEYRKYLTNNADSIIEYNQKQCINMTGTVNVKPFFSQISETIMGNQNKNTPYLYQSCQSNEKPYGYEDSDLKKDFLSKQQLESRMISPSIKRV